MFQLIDGEKQPDDLGQFPPLVESTGGPMEAKLSLQISKYGAILQVENLMKKQPQKEIYIICNTILWNNDYPAYTTAFLWKNMQKY